MTDPQLHAYQTLPRARYARIHDEVTVAMRHSDRPCVGDACDLDAPCKRHERTVEVVDRYLRLRDAHRRWARAHMWDIGGYGPTEYDEGRS